MRLFRTYLLFEFAVGITVVALFCAALAARLAYHKERAEKANMEFTISALKSALRVQKSLLLIRGQTRDVQLLTHSNPMEWLEHKPANYLGQLESPPSASRAEGNWYFDVNKMVLVYTPKRSSYFRSSQQSSAVQLRLVSPVAESTPRTDPAVLAVRIQILAPHQWF
jgi:hypothetical protein